MGNSTYASANTLCRVLHKIPDMLESFIGRAADLLNDRNHGVLLSGGYLCMVANIIGLGRFI